MKKINYLTLILIVVILLICILSASNATAITPLMILVIITLTIALLTLFLIHHKTLQIRLTIYNTILLIAQQIWFFIALEKIKLVDIFPLICAILSVTAILEMRREESLGKLIKLLKKQKKNRKI